MSLTDLLVFGAIVGACLVGLVLVGAAWGGGRRGPRPAPRSSTRHPGSSRLVHAPQPTLPSPLTSADPDDRNAAWSRGG